MLIVFDNIDARDNVNLLLLLAKIQNNTTIYLSQEECSMVEAMAKKLNIKVMPLGSFEKIVGQKGIKICSTKGLNNELKANLITYCDSLVSCLSNYQEFDLVAKIQNKKFYPGKYSEGIWQLKLKRAKHNSRKLNWFIAKNYPQVFTSKLIKVSEAALNDFAKKFGIKLITGVSQPHNLDNFINKDQELFTEFTDIHEVLLSQELHFLAQEITSI